MKSKVSYFSQAKNEEETLHFIISLYDKTEFETEFAEYQVTENGTINIYIDNYIFEHRPDLTNVAGQILLQSGLRHIIGEDIPDDELLRKIYKNTYAYNYNSDPKRYLRAKEYCKKEFFVPELADEPKKR